MVQTDTEIANTICQRNLNGELTDSYYMWEDFGEIFYIDENWLYYSEYGEGDSESVYRVPFSHKDGKEYPEFSKKEFLFSEPDGLAYSDFMESSFLQIVDNTIYYYAIGKDLATYNLETGEHKYYLTPGSMFAAGTHYAVAEGEKQCDILVNLETGKSQVMETDAHPWLRLGKECYLMFPYTLPKTGTILFDLNSGETIDIISQKEAEQIAKEIGVPSGNEYEYIRYIGYYNHRVYAETSYSVTFTDKKGREVTIGDAVCVGRNMDEEDCWPFHIMITAIE